MADSLRSIGISHVAQLQGISEAQLVARAALRPATAARLVAWGRGEDEAVVAEQGPAKSMQVGQDPWGRVSGARSLPRHRVWVCEPSCPCSIPQSHTPFCRGSPFRGLVGAHCKRHLGCPHTDMCNLADTFTPPPPVVAQASALPHPSSPARSPPPPC